MARRRTRTTAESVAFLEVKRLEERIADDRDAIEDARTRIRTATAELKAKRAEFIALADAADEEQRRRQRERREKKRRVIAARDAVRQAKRAQFEAREQREAAAHEQTEKEVAERLEAAREAQADELVVGVPLRRQPMGNN